MSTDTFNNSDYIEAPVNYLEHGTEKPVTYLYEPPAGVPARSGGTTKHWMKIRNGRLAINELTLDRQGFAFVRHPTQLSNFTTPKKSLGFIIRSLNGC